MGKDQSKLGGSDSKDLSQQAHTQLIGLLGLLLPVLLYLLAGLRPSDGLPPWTLLPSVSAYYYTGAVGVFVRVLFALSLFLFTYPGYQGIIADRLVGSLGWAAALGIALFPTTAPDGTSAPSWWVPMLRVVHYVSAVLLFTAFILFAVWLFRKLHIPLRRDRPRDRRRRDDACLACGLIMIGCVLWVASAMFTQGLICWPESIAIAAVAVSWLVKGEAHQQVLTFVRWVSAGTRAQ